MLQKYLVLFLFILGLSACSTHNLVYLNKTENVNSGTLFNDQLFPDYAQIHIESEDDIFYLSDAVKKYMDDNIFPVHDSIKRVETLADILFDQASLNLIYANDANTTASQTFINQQANCLSMTILAYSMAKYAGLDVLFQEVKIPEYWVRRDGHSLLNGHINLKIRPKPDPTHRAALQFGSEYVEVDFNRDLPIRHFTKVPSNKSRLMAMFYNNKGADALLVADFSRAYAYFKQALSTDPKFIPAWGNLGILYRYINQFDLAENAYLYALKLDNSNLNNLENLAILKDFKGEKQQAYELFRMLDNKRQSNPYYHFILGEEQYEEGHWDRAIVYYNRALRLDNKVHEFYFGLAKAYYQLADTEKSRKYLKLAKRNSINEAMENRYQGKLDLLSRN